MNVCAPSSRIPLNQQSSIVAHLSSSVYQSPKHNSEPSCMTHLDDCMEMIRLESTIKGDLFQQNHQMLGVDRSSEYRVDRESDEFGIGECDAVCVMFDVGSERWQETGHVHGREREVAGGNRAVANLSRKRSF